MKVVGLLAAETLKVDTDENYDIPMLTAVVEAAETSRTRMGSGVDS